MYPTRRLIGKRSPEAGSRITREAMIRMTAAAATNPTNAPDTFQKKANPNNRTVLMVEKPMSKLACVRKRRRPFAVPTNTV